MKNYLTIDVEEHFQVSAFEGAIDQNEWDSHESRVEKNTYLLLDCLSDQGVFATFFIVGWVAERYPSLVREIIKRGHEVGCHSYLHRKVYDLTPDEFLKDTSKAKDILEQITGEKISGYRAPSYSITNRSIWAFDILEELGFEYDSSIFPIVHDNYGIPDAPRFKYPIIGKNIVEYPISTVKITGLNIPVAGGGYFRLFPYWLTKFLLERIHRKDQKPFMFYLHPWEVDPYQPRVKNAGLLSRFRHYNNLEKTESRLKRLLKDFNFSSIKNLHKNT
ncbi:XrtA system polysaccharide deacetylase [Desulfopila sp. IMCC35008]|uniref:XrtA system polysaccharide deacetylase n=1 Tax=Desulfopila sp. IMCC35008 TaxID=2653858 RepID=UPI0013D18733|nr:XrtA system polysaccharide deacetylase [Desulfopila sp. IMCC35008]